MLKAVSNIWLVVLATAVAACGGGDWEPYEPDPGALPDDSVKKTEYPSGPFGTKVGDKITDLSFDGLQDPDTPCKSAQDLDLTATDGVQTLSMEGLFKGDPLCQKKKKQLVWLVATAGW